MTSSLDPGSRGGHCDLTDVAGKGGDTGHTMRLTNWDLRGRIGHPSEIQVVFEMTGVGDFSAELGQWAGRGCVTFQKS